MTLVTILTGILIALFLVVGALFVLFGQITVRKLRKNPETKDALGFEYISGTEIINVVKVLAIPRAKAQKLKEGQMSFLYADIDLLYKHTSRIDRILAKVLYYFLILDGILLIMLVLLNLIGNFD